jgi:hypothetical protein
VRIRFIVLGLSLFAAACAAPAASPPPESPGMIGVEAPQSYTFRLIIGADTIASDVVRRTPTAVEVDLINRMQGVRSHLTMTVADDERVTDAMLSNFRLAQPDTEPISILGVELAGDSVRGELTRRDRGMQRAAFPTQPGAVVYLETAGATVEQVLRRARALSGEAATVPVFDLLTARTTPAVVRWVGSDSAVVTYGDLEVHATMDEAGSLLEFRVPALNAHAIRLEGSHPLTVHESHP